MTPRVSYRPRARLDPIGQFIYFDEQSGVEAAERYLEAVEETCKLLAGHPQSGVRYQSGIPGLSGVRRVPVTGFDKYLIFYLCHRGGIEVVRVLHGAGDLENLLAQEESKMVIPSSSK